MSIQNYVVIIAYFLQNVKYFLKLFTTISEISMNQVVTLRVTAQIDRVLHSTAAGLNSVFHLRSTLLVIF